MVAVPIGNADDWSPRAVRTLKECDLVIAEDTRVALRRLAGAGIKKPVERYDHHSHGKVISKIAANLREGMKVAFISDAGTPGVEDPGGRLVEAVADLMPTLPIIPIPGPSSVMAALSVSGFPAEHFSVCGFPPKKKSREKYFDAVISKKETVVIYESTHRILKTMDSLAKRAPERRAIIARELTKKYETILRGTLSDLSRRLTSEVIKGEFVIVLSPI